MNKKDKLDIIEKEDKKEKVVESLQDIEKKKADKLKEQVKATVEGFWNEAIGYQKIGNVLLLNIREDLEVCWYKKINLIELKNMCDKVKEFDTFFTDFISFDEMKIIVDNDYRMLEGKDVDGNQLEMDMDNVLLIKCKTPGFEKLKTVGAVRIPKDVDIIKEASKNIKYLNL